MRTIKVELAERSYEIRVGAGLLSRVGPWINGLGFSGKAVVITDTTVKKLYAASLLAGLERAGFTPTVLEVPPGEAYKSLETAGRLYGEMTAARAERLTPVIALGGGVIGDLTGFVAATYLRGVPLVQVPTTLLAQVDSSIGGKTAIDHGRLKNIVGAFYQPVQVVADIDTLKTLSEAEVANGLAEVIKSAAVGDRDLFDYLYLNIEQAKELRPAALENVVVASAGIKADIVAADERDEGPREVLNYGHTVGHAVEAASGFSLKHGQAVSIGMVAAARISQRMGLLKESEVARLVAVLRKAGLPVAVPSLASADIFEAMSRDKKVRRDRVRFVLLRSIGDAFISDDVDMALVEEVVSEQG
ncbi:MAG: 3-dehydroquinate synthase [Chloroflexi bacterium RBG_16_56_11]|nr:MAG: 3-dehydroquinate synthase [Chloroflexi bacterium RBG_16_56_11]